MQEEAHPLSFGSFAQSNRLVWVGFKGSPKGKHSAILSFSVMFVGGVSQNGICSKVIVVGSSLKWDSAIVEFLCDFASFSTWDLFGPMAGWYFKED